MTALGGWRSQRKHVKPPFSAEEVHSGIRGEEGTLTLMTNEEKEEGKGREIHARPLRPGNFNDLCATLKL